MKPLFKFLASGVLLAGLTCAVPVVAAATDFEPLGEGVLPSGKYLQNFRFTIYPGENVPWHYHPGQIFGVITSGTLTEETGCGRPAETLVAGAAFTEAPGAIHRVFNRGIEPVVIVFTFVVPPRYAGYTGTIFVNGPRCDH